MHYLITGGTGLIGSHFIKQLSHQDRVTLVTRNVEKAEATFKRNKQTINYLASINQVENLNDVDVVINLAGEPIADKRWTEKQKHKIQTSRWQITQDLVDKINHSDTPPKLFISGSAIGYYGRQGDTPIAEDYSQIHTEFTHAVCKPWEDIALQAQSPQTRVCILRTGIVLAKGKGALAKMALPFYFGAGATMGSGQQGMSWIHLEDMVKGIQFLTSTDSAQGIFNFTAPNPVSHKQFCQDLATALRRPCWFNLPGIMMTTMLGEMADLLLYGQYVTPTKLLDEGYEFSHPQLLPALKALYQ